MSKTYRQPMWKLNNDQFFKHLANRIVRRHSKQACLAISDDNVQTQRGKAEIKTARDHWDICDCQRWMSEQEPDFNVRRKRRRIRIARKHSARKV